MSEKIKIILLEWNEYHRQYKSLRLFEYNGVKYYPGNLVSPMIVDWMKADEMERKEILKQLK